MAIIPSIKKHKMAQTCNTDFILYFLIFPLSKLTLCLN